MPRYYAQIGCPACGTRFQTPVDRILDVRVEPEARERLLSGTVNMAACPNCGAGGKLNLPFLYHDPSRELALLYLPLEVGKNEVDRQQQAGKLTRELVDSLPVEERKGYLLQPETFFNVETLVRRVLEAEGVTDAQMDRSRQQQELIGKLLQAPEAEREGILQEAGDLVDETFFGLLEYSVRLVAASAPTEEDFNKVRGLYVYMVDRHPMGQILKKRTEVLQKFSEESTRESLVEALVQAPDDMTLNALVQMGVPLMDYTFFQELLKRIEGTTDAAEHDRLAEMRRKVLDIRQKLMEMGKEVSRQRVDLLNRLLSSEDPIKLARSHLSELDDLFFSILTQELEGANRNKEADYAQALQKLGQVIARVQEETMPPQVALLRRMLVSNSEEEVDHLLKENVDLLDIAFFQFMDAMENNSRERGDEPVAERLAVLKARAQAISGFQMPGQDEEAGGEPPAAAAPKAPSAPESPKPPMDGPRTTPSGLIIAKK